MTRSLKIAVADDELDMRDYFQQILPLLGHQVVAVAQTGRELVDLCATTRPDLVITWTGSMPPRSSTATPRSP